MIDIFKTPVQSPEGDKYLRDRHVRVSTELGKYPTITSKLLSQGELSQLLEKLLKRSGNLSTVTYPYLYIAPDLINTGMLPKDYLARVETGLDFIIRKAPKQNREDLLGRLRKDNALTAIFELQLAWALVSHFGEGSIELFPKISQSSSKNVEFGVVRGPGRVLIEATTLGETKAELQERQLQLELGIPNMKWAGADENEMRRLFRACHEKIHQRDLVNPLVLCVNQLATWPSPDDGADVIGKLIASEIWSRDSMFVGAAYFWADNLVCTSFAEARARAIGADPVLLSEIRTALCRLVDPNAVRTAFDSSIVHLPEAATTTPTTPAGS